MEIKKAEFKRSIKGTDDILYEPKLQVAFIGRSNVGKSSLINRLLNKKNLVKTGKLPGKTREINFFLINDSFYFVDLPGYGYAKMSLSEREQLSRMIQWYFSEKVFKRKVVLILDIKVGPSVMDVEMLEFLSGQGQDVIIVANKADSVNKHERDEEIKAITEMLETEIIPCSAKTKEGRDEILKRLFE
jgi:GTP-binding protein